MINGGRLLQSLVSDALGGGGKKGRRRRRKRRERAGLGTVATGAIGMGALGVAIGAFEHFAQKRQAPPGGAPPGPVSGGNAAPPPPLPTSGAPATPPPLPPLPVPAAAPADSEALVLVRAMVAAANADHVLDTDERRRIVDALVEAECTDEERGFLLAELERPWPIASLVEAASTPELARQVYLASLMAIDVDNDAERNYLGRLADRLGLSAEAVAELEDMLEPDDGEDEGEA